MKKNIDYFHFAQILSSEYSPILTDEAVKNRLLKIFDGQVSLDQFKEDLTPREFVNKFLLHYYPNETAVKSAFINKILFKESNHVSIFELNVGNSRVDLCKINGISTAFEIKTDLDNPKRLGQQMTDYFKVFEKVYLICSTNNFDIMLPYIPEECGIYTYSITKTGNYVFKRKRTAIKSTHISPIAQLSIFTKRELKVYFDCPIYEDKEDMINLIIKQKSDKEINKMFKDYLKNKYHKKWEFLVENKDDILEIDYQWFFKNMIDPEIVYL